MTIPFLMSAPHIFTTVPLGLKRPILEKFFSLAEATEAIPASILLHHEGNLYVDRNSCPEKLLPPE